MNKLFLLGFCILGLLSIGSVAAADVASCKKEYKAKEYGSAIQSCRAASVKGEPSGKYYLGLMYLYGQGLRSNTALAERLIKEAAQLSDVAALKKLGRIYQSGELGEINPAKSCTWWERLADLGNDVGQEKIGVCYLLGRGRTKDMKLGYAYLSLASKNGNAAAKYIIDRYGDRFPASAKQEALMLADKIEAN